MNCDLELIDGTVCLREDVLAICDAARYKALKIFCEDNELVLTYKVINASSDTIALECASIIEVAKARQSFIIVSFDDIDHYKKIAALLDTNNVAFCSEYALQLCCDIKDRKLGSFAYELDKFNKVYMKYSLSCKKLISAVEKDCVLVYQRSKVGSSTICKSLDLCNINNIHIHQLNYLQPYKYLDFRLPQSVGNIEMFNGADDFMSDLWDALKKKSLIKIITCVRDPLARDFSEFFQSLEWPAFELDRIAEENLPFLRACKTYIDQTSSISQEKWFDNEIKHIFDVDVFEFPFDKEQGYSIIKKGNVEVLVLKLERMSFLEHIISDFLAVPNFRLVNANTNDSKISRTLYNLVRKKLSFSEEELDKYYSNKSRMLHFYTEDEFAKFRAKWNNQDG